MKSKIVLFILLFLSWGSNKPGLKRYGWRSSYRNQMFDTETRFKKPIRSFKDLDVYQNTYGASIEVISKIIPKLPKVEQDDLADQLRRSAKAIPRLIAEGYSKKHQKKGFQKYLDDAMAESNEMIVSLSHARD